MADAITVSAPVGGAESKILCFEAGRLAGQADGAVLSRMGETTILVTATAARRVREGTDFFPLTVDIEERMYAAGKIPGSFFRREGRAAESAILTCRLIDRPLRPSFPEGFRNEVHIVGTVLGADQENPYDVLAINGASAALSISGIPFAGPIGAVRIAHNSQGEWVAHPTYVEGSESTFEMVVAGRVLDDGDVAIMMVEANGTEASCSLYEGGTPKMDEAALAEGLEASKEWIKEAVGLQRRLIATVGVKAPMEYELQVDYTPEVNAAVAEVGTAKLTAAMTIADKAERQAAEDQAKEEILAVLLERFNENDNPELASDIAKQASAAVRSLTKSIVRNRIVSEGIRIDGRSTTDIRPLAADVGIVDISHGSGLFERGETQVLNIATLGTARMDQMIDGIDPNDKKRYIHHYNFPPYSTGETGFMRGPKRREIGHGALAEKALVPVIPHMDDFPYTLRLVSEVLSSNGSTSMASVCASTLSLMDAGVPIAAPVAGIAMGLVLHEGQYITLTDILGAEDAYGDMDFKVAGTADFVTALQLDTKIDGLPAEVLAGALNQAREARLKILDVMVKAIDAPRSDVRPTAPKIVKFEIPLDKIGEVIGPKGKVINSIQVETGAEVSVDDHQDSGMVTIASSDRDSVNEAERQIRLILDPPTAGVGEVYTGKVVNITSFGAFVNILPGRDGLVHISKLGRGTRIDRVEDVLSLGDELEVVVEDIDPNGKISLMLAGDEGAADSSGRHRDDRRYDDRDDRDRGPRRDRRNGRDDRRYEQRRDRNRRSDRDDRRDDRRGSRYDDRYDGRRDRRDQQERERESGSQVASFEDDFEQQLRDEFGDLGPSGVQQRRGRNGARGR
ncbi:MAG: polyribonucleotide nucleotidyltransferase [Acidimicrobiia bacterium]|nr:polyribonucleotide nucleotidyltransferase [Acidimicrobiia bacterium]MYC58161.1 polyribonucleotide nucleotidyltransferase [Acidimicrobiia bacterium]MYG94352.1 polyribonucleotide nucleotidyltransferase [Acidimicrobiia bacterium]MYI30593.1 polyribonucleotide nucleotidyltransferase [Acidimicrobiia bacterium]